MPPDGVNINLPPRLLCFLTLSGKVCLCLGDKITLEEVQQRRVSTGEKRSRQYVGGVYLFALFFFCVSVGDIYVANAEQDITPSFLPPLTGEVIAVT